LVFRAGVVAVASSPVAVPIQIEDRSQVCLRPLQFDGDLFDEFVPLGLDQIGRRFGSQLVDEGTLQAV
jgi:hypothetical protein